MLAIVGICSGHSFKAVSYTHLDVYKRQLQDCAAVVIALKTRSIPAAEAVRETLKAVRWLKQHGAEQLYLKYCSTFDSTPEGNIGPDIDVVLEAYQIPYTILCPALPINRRIVKDGVLIVDDKPVAEGHMALSLIHI